MDSTLLLNEWVHYVIVYSFVDPNTPASQFSIYKNGQSHNSGNAGQQAKSIIENSVNSIGIGRKHISDNSPPYFDGVLDEFVIIAGSLDAGMVDLLFQHYQ